MNKINRIYGIVFGVGMLVFSGLSRVCYSASEESTETETVSEDTMLFQEIPSVYSASKYEQKVTDAPSSISIITADEIKKYGYRNFAAILNSVRGFHVTYDRMYSYLGARGFGLPGDYNTRILVLIDGHRLNDNIYNSALIETAFPVDIDLIDRVEIVRGPGSSLYGNNAFFAVINVITRQGRDFKGTEVSGEAGSFYTYKPRLSYGNRFSSGLEMLFSTSYYTSQGDDRLFFKEYDHPETNHGIAKDQDSDQFKSFFSKLQYRDFTLQGAFHAREKDVPTAAWGAVFNEKLPSTDDTAWLDLKFDHIYENQVSVLARTSYNYYHYTGDYPYTWGAPYPDIVYNSDDVTGQWLRGEVQLTKTLLDNHKGTVGVEGQYNLQQKQLNYDHIPGGINLDDKQNSQYWAVYLQDEYTITDYLTLNAGVRFDYYDTFGDTINPRAALIYNPFEKSTFKVIYGSAFRAPNAYEFYYDAGSLQKTNPALKPETINSYELVYEQYFGKHYRGTIVGFYNDIEDLIALQTDPLDGILVFENVDTVSAKGMEFEMEGKWDGGHEARVSYTFEEAENKETGKILVNSPEHMVKLNLIGALLKEKVFLGVEEQYTSRRKTISDNFADSFFITNATLCGRNIFKTLEISGSIYNLFDEKYVVPASEEHLQDTIEQDGRTFRIKLTYAF